MLNGVTSDLERYMDLLSTRQRLVASNIANAGIRLKTLIFNSNSPL
jgi:flagellar basal body rod protein FlgB